jgi:hypothetical protein
MRCTVRCFPQRFKLVDPVTLFSGPDRPQRQSQLLRRWSFVRRASFHVREGNIAVMSTVDTLGLGYLFDGDLAYLIRFGINTRHLHLTGSICCLLKVGRQFFFTILLVCDNLQHPFTEHGTKTGIRPVCYQHNDLVPSR